MQWHNLSERLDRLGIRPNIRNLHQYFLIDEEMLRTTVAMAEIEPGDTVVEIGAGVGNITELLAQEADRVIAYEVDTRFRPFLGPLAGKYDNLTIHFKDIKRAKWPKFDRLVANVPFNTLEPVLPKLIQTKFRNAILIVGNRFKNSVIESFSQERITKLNVLVHSFFLVDELRVIEKGKFYPEPKTDAIMVELIPTNPRSPFLQFCRTLFMNRNKLVQHVLMIHETSKEGKRIRRHKVELPLDIANKRVDRLSNYDFQRLFTIFLR